MLYEFLRGDAKALISKASASLNRFATKVE